MKNKEVVLVTGCSTGMGRDICTILNKKGYIVVATARKREALNDVPATLKLKMDVTDKESIHSAVNEIIQKFNKIDVLVNNAGYTVRGALEEVSIDNVKKMFDVNVFGIINMIQEVLPEMRKVRSGKIINVGSISGLFTQGINGGYCASKHAVEAVSDALRLELKKYNIQSTVIELGAIETNFFKTLSKTSDKLMQNQNSPYSDLYQADLNYRNTQKHAKSRDAAAQICKVIMSNKLKPRYKIFVPFLFKILLKLPDSMKEFMLLKHQG